MQSLASLDRGVQCVPVPQGMWCQGQIDGGMQCLSLSGSKGRGRVRSSFRNSYGFARGKSSSVLSV